MPNPREGKHHRPLWVTAHLAGPIAQEPPYLDAILVWAQSIHVLATKDLSVAQDESWKITRSDPAPPQGEILIPIAHSWLGDWLVYHSSMPVLAPVAHDGVEHYTRRISVENALLLDPGERKIVNTTGGWTKSYRLPLRLRTTALIRWCCVGDRSEIRKLLKRVKALGKKRSQGYGVVERWEVEEAPADCSWFAPHPDGRILMRVLPLGDCLPANLVGFRRDYAGVSPPYWHRDRFVECVSPC